MQAHMSPVRLRPTTLSSIGTTSFFRKFILELYATDLEQSGKRNCCRITNP